MNINAVIVIKERLTMSDVLSRYGFAVNRRIPCPLHNGTDNNFEIKNRNWRCYSRCGSGDVISFVEKLFNITFQEALRRIDADFSLNIYGEHTFEELRRSHYEQKALEARRKKDKLEREKADAEYWEAFDEWKRLFENRIKYKPRCSDEKLHPLFVESLQKLDFQRYILDFKERNR